MWKQNPCVQRPSATLSNSEWMNTEGLRCLEYVFDCNEAWKRARGAATDWVPRGDLKHQDVYGKCLVQWSLNVQSGHRKSLEASQGLEGTSGAISERLS